MRRALFTLLLCIGILNCFAQTAPKTLPAKRTSSVIKIDGVMDEAAWKDAPAALGYTEFRPTPFRKEEYADRTETYMLYNDDGIYLGGYCHERTKDSISAELNGRDGFGNNDYIGIIFDTYNDKQNGFEYFITPLNDQMDAKMSVANGEDFSWNAVWQSATKIHEDGWSFEIFIPFSAIRFSKLPLQNWGMNITRRRKKTEQQVTWNPIDVNVNGFLTQEGFWTSLSNIHPPLRLQFFPYVSAYTNHYPYNTPGVSNWSNSYDAGMDLKYGISQALTLDMTLVPDFGQVQSDNLVLNLSPFEVKYNDNRPFFTEGTELFTKGNFFYSRRVGGLPVHYYDVQDTTSSFAHVGAGEHLVSNPSETRLLNAAKISGRLRSGLGIGFFNAVTAASYAVVTDNNGHSREIETSPLTNYNIMVLDQSLKNNSSISFINTSVMRAGADYDANVSAGLFNLNDKTNTWNLGGKLAVSSLYGYLPGGRNQTGYSHSLYFGKVSGRFNFMVEEDLSDNKFNSNDLGYFTNNNYLNHSLYMGYHWTTPTKWYNNLFLNFNALYTDLLIPFTYQNANFNVNANTQLKNLWQLSAGVAYEPLNNNFYEPRVAGRVFKGWADWYTWASLQTNASKNYSVNAQVVYVPRSFFFSRRYQFNVVQSYRFSKKFSLSYSLDLEPQTNNVGYAAIASNNDIIFGLRDIKTVENILSFKYSFTHKLVLTTRMRHYWSEVNYKNFFTLQQDGGLQPNTTFTDNVNQNYNVFTVDMLCTWEFAPGSFINLDWKNNTSTLDSTVNQGYFNNFNHTMASPQNNNYSVKVIYFIDYLALKKKPGKLPV